MFMLGAFLDAIGGMGFDYVASGHYANVIHPCSDRRDEPSVLELSQDMVPIWDINLWLQDLVCVCGLYIGDISVLSVLSEESLLISLYKLFMVVLSFAYFFASLFITRK